MTDSKYRLTALLVESAYHSAGEDDILGIGADLTVALEWKRKPDLSRASNFPEFVAAFDIVDELNQQSSIANLQMFDEKQGDGIYARTYKIQPGDNATNGTIFINITQTDGTNLGRVKLKRNITIDTLPPGITTIRHNAIDAGRKPRPLSAGMELKVSVETVEQASEVKDFVNRLNIEECTFEITGENFKVREELFDDGEHDDGEPNDGILGGVYIVQPGDNVEDATLTIYVEDIAHNKATGKSEVGVTFDTLKPVIESLTPQIFTTPTNSDGEKTLVAGDRLQVELKGEKGGEAEFDLGEIRPNVELFDDGTHGDETPDDGVYTNSYVIRAGENAQNSVITGRLKDKAHNVAELESQILITIDTTKPAIEQVTLYLGGGRTPYPPLPTARPIIKGETLVVILKGEQGHTAAFDIGELQKGLLMFVLNDGIHPFKTETADDGAGEDSQANDGEYVGIYEVQDGDDAPGVAIITHLIDEAGNEETKAASQRVTIDAVPPPPVNIIRAYDKLNDEGNVIIVEWEKSDAKDFSHYNIYAQAKTPIRYTLGLIPLKTSLFNSGTTVTEVILPKNNLDYYFAITVVDIARNVSSLAKPPSEGELSQSVFGPVQAKDNIPPSPIIVVTARDKSIDQGKTLIVEWTEISREEDFERYIIYISDKKIDDVEKLEAEVEAEARLKSGIQSGIQLNNRDILSAEVAVEADGVDYYVAVTARDQNGNQSPLDGGGKSVFGPVQTKDELPPTPVLGLIAIDTPSDKGSQITVSWFPKTDEDVNNYNIYLSERPTNSETDIQTLKNTADIFVAEGEDTDIIDIPTKGDNEDYYIAVTAVDIGGNESLLDEDGNSATGPVQSVSNFIRADAKTIVTAGFDPNTKIILEPNTATTGDMVNIFDPTKEPIDEALLQKINEANGFLSEAHIDENVDDMLKDTVREFVFNGGDRATALTRPVTIVISYPAEITDRRIEEGIRIFKLSEESQAALWELVPGKQTVDFNAHTISVEFNWDVSSSLSPNSQNVVFRVARLKFPDNLGEVAIYPNPFYPESQEQVNFVNLTVDATIDIYTLNGELVRSIDSESATGRAKWNGRNEAGKEVAGGLYICLIKSEADKTVRKIMVMR